MNHTRPPEQFQTNRLLLRKPKREDATALFEAYTSDPDVTHYLTWTPHTSVEETRSFLEGRVAAWEEGSDWGFVLEHVQSPAQPFGMIAMHTVSPATKGFGYVLARPYWGQGYMSEALSALVTWALEQPEIWRAQVFCDVENIASQRVIEKSGLTFEGVLKKFFVHPNISDVPRDCRMYGKVRQVP